MEITSEEIEKIATLRRAFRKISSFHNTDMLEIVQTDVDELFFDFLSNLAEELKRGKL